MAKVTAYQARTNFGDLLNRVYYGGEEIVVERKGEPMVTISKFKAKKEDKTSLMKFAGLWKDLDTDKIIENIYSSRKDGSADKKTLLKW